MNVRDKEEKAKEEAEISSESHKSSKLNAASTKSQ
jgi:hypothetical protein